MPAFDPDSFGFVLADATRLMRAELDHRTSEAGLGLSAGDARTLSHAARGGPVRQARLAELIGIEAMTVSTSLDRLEAHGLVSRQPDPGDRRAKIVNVTEAGMAVLAEIQPVVAQLHADAAAGISAIDWVQFLDTLRQVRANLTVARERRKEGASS